MSTITLPNIRVSSDLTIRLKLKDGGVAIDWSTLQNIRVSLYADDQRSMASRCNVSIDEEDSTILVCQYAANKMQYLGVNRVIVQCKYLGEVKTYDKPAFTFVRWTSDQEGEQITIDDPDVDVEISVEDVSSSILQEAVDAAFDAADRANDAAAAAEHMVDIHTGPEGKSAYEVAVEEGYTGTEEEWLASLKGPVGETPDISIGTVTTVEPGTPAAASMSGTPEAPVLNLSIPKGLVGATPNFTVGTVATGEPGSSVIVTITGTPEAPVLNLTIPQGMQGNTGSSVEYPYELVNNLTTNDATKGLSAAQGYVLDGKVSQLEAKVDEIYGGVIDVPLDLSDSDLWMFGDVNSSTGAVTTSSVRTITKRIKNPSGTISADYTNAPNRVVSVVFLYDASETYLGHDEAAGNRASFNFDQLKQNYPLMDSIIICQYFKDYDPTITNADDIINTIAFSGTATQKGIGEGWKPQIDANTEFSEDAKPIVDSFVLKDSPNLFNPNDPDVAIGYYIYTDYLEASATYNTSGYIPVQPNTTYYKSQECREFRFVSYFGTNKDYLSNEANKDSFTTPVNCYFVRVSFYANVYGYAQVAKQDISFVPFGKSLCLSGAMGITDDSVATKKYVDDSSGSGSNDFLAGKKWCPLGDSFTEGVTNTTISDGIYTGEKKVYPFFIGNRTGINVVKTFFAGGRTLAFPATPGDFTNSICNPSALFYYQNIPADVNYITIYLGINDSHHAPGSGGGDGEDNTGEIPIGTITDNTPSTYYGAWNVVLSWLIENRPNAHIGIIVSNGCDTADYRTAQLAIARKYGIPFIDLNGDDRTPFMIRSQNTDIDATIRAKRTQLQSVDYPTNQHPNDDAHLFESYFIESWLRTI